MRSYSATFIRLVGLGALVMICTSAARGQCGVNSRGFGDLGIVSGNPFTAEIVITRSDSPSLAPPPLLLLPEQVARDGEGRVRVDRAGGKFKHDNGPETGTEEVAHAIEICDTGAETLTMMDTVNATAKIVHARPSALSRSLATRTFCSTRFPSARNPNVAVEDLGERVIEGVAAHGKRITSQTLTIGGNADGAAGATLAEVWCSDEIAAVVLRTTENTRTGAKTTTAMQKIERSEPDPALFQIPADYAVTESVAPARENQIPNAQPGPR
ncbi:MAG TPA: hypothetical protein VEG64_10095 [Candidatus Sulfotelmatobacter sp.]|nr:hypothetical protein [Candidatus Sulfotelmatobacter sp.]